MAERRHGESDANTIDGFVRSPRQAAQTSEKARARNHPTRTTSKVFDVSRRRVAHAPAHQPEKAKTLMRHVVHRPNAASIKRRARTVSNLAATIKAPNIMIAPKLSFHTLDADRLKRAKRIARSGLISRFGNLQIYKMPSTPAATTLKVRQQAAKTVAAEPNMPSDKKQPSSDIFERALRHANSHKQPLAPKPRSSKSHLSHIGSVTASSLAILLIVGFITYQNEANIQMRIASARADVSASMPKWRPTDFAVGQFTYGPGTVTVSFHSNNDQRAFELTQTASNWDSASLLNNFVTVHGDSYSAIQSNGRLIYTYGDNNATWVTNGIWYKLTSNGNLSTSQIVQLANSI